MQARSARQWQRTAPRWWALWSVVVVGSAVFAQDAPPAVDVRGGQAEEVPVAQRASWIANQTQFAKNTYLRVQNMLDEARRDKDAVKIGCLEDKLTQIHVNIQGVEERAATFDAAVQAGDNATADQQFTVLSIYFQRIRSLAAEAGNCVGQNDVVVGQSETTVTVDEDIAVQNPASESQDLVTQVGTDQLPQASGYY